MSKEKKVFYVDTREPANIKSEILDFLESSLRLEFKALQFGDFIYNGICIERKTYPDFIRSVKTTSFWRKLKETKENFTNAFLYLEGEELDLIEVQAMSKAKVKKIYEGSIITIQLMNIPILRFRTFLKFLEFLVLLIKKSDEKEAENKKGEEEDLFINSHRKKEKALSELKIESLTCIPGIGSKAAFNLMKTYGSIDKIIHLTENENKSKGREKKLVAKVQQFFLSNNTVMQYI